MDTKDSIRPVFLAGISGVVMAHAVITYAWQLKFVLGPDTPVERLLVSGDGQPITLVELTAYTSGSPPMSIQDALKHAQAYRG